MQKRKLRMRVCFAALLCVGVLSSAVYISKVMSHKSNQQKDKSVNGLSTRVNHQGKEWDYRNDSGGSVNEDGHALDTGEQPVCKPPQLKLSSPEIDRLLYDQTDLHCGGPPMNYLTYLDRNPETGKAVIRLNVSAIDARQKIHFCRYDKIEFKTNGFVDTTVWTKYLRDNNMTLDFPFKDEYARVACRYKTEVITDNGTVSSGGEHNNIFHQIKRKPAVQRVAKPVHESARVKGALGGGLNVLMVGVDSTSRMNFMRKLPKTFKYFTETLQGYVLKGFNVVGDGTTPAFLGMLPGFRHEEIRGCIRVFREDDEEEKKRKEAENTLCDSVPWIWWKYKKMAYGTMFSDDDAAAGIFNYALRGFSSQPTDHYMYPFWSALEDLPGYEKEQFCLNAVPKHQYTLQYARDFVDKYNDSLKFSTSFHVQLTHDSPNLIQAADEDLLDLLRYWHDKGHLDKTILVVFADHGLRQGAMRTTFQGRLEEMLPFFGIVVPQWIKEKYPEIAKNLHKNQERLTTAFDFHKMLQHILDYPGDPSSFQGHGMSLFQEVPLNRTCEDATIGDHWCTCLQTISVSTSDGHVQTAAKYLVAYINNMTLPHRNDCMELSLKNITRAEIMKTRSSRAHDDQLDVSDADGKIFTSPDFPFIDFKLTVETEPNGGLYEASVRKWLIRPLTEVTADISRINKYGDHPKCIYDKFPSLRKFCFCKEFFHQS